MLKKNFLFYSINLFNLTEEKLILFNEKFCKKIFLFYSINLFNSIILFNKRKKEISAIHEEESVRNTRVTTVKEDIVCHSREHLSMS